MVLFRAAVWASIFIAFFLVFLPARVLSGSGIVGPGAMGLAQVTGMLLAAAGAAISLWCIFTFALIGKGTPAPFDPPRKLVMSGPYRFVRNPMYLGAGFLLAGAALFYASTGLLLYTALFLAACHLMVIGYEEPALRKTFGGDYAAYCEQVRRWIPRF